MCILRGSLIFPYFTPISVQNVYTVYLAFVSPNFRVLRSLCITHFIICRWKARLCKMSVDIEMQLQVQYSTVVGEGMVADEVAL